MNVKRHKTKKQTRRLLWIGGSVAAVLLGSALGCLIWYKVQLSALDSSSNQQKTIIVQAGSSPEHISEQLESESIIRSARAFSIYTRLTGTQGQLQAGSYRLSAANTVPEIVDKLTKGTVESFDITFVPGATLAANRQVLISAGYNETEVDSALAYKYDSPILAGKPDEADLEGYIYPETYKFAVGTSAQQVIERSLEEFYKQVQDNNLEEKFAQQDLNLRDAIILASIVEKESSRADYQKQIAQVFFLRLSIGMGLEADATYQYIADKLGVPRDVNLDNPYNTRRYGGLPPGPISVPGLSALMAVADPAQGDYLYYVSGDDGMTYFSKTYAQHQANVAEHCIIKCSSL